MTKGIIASLSAAAVLTTGAFFGASAMTAEPAPEQTPTAVVVTVEENTLRQEAPDTVRRSVLPAPEPVVEETVIATEPAPAPDPAPAPEPEREAVSGNDCPPPNVQRDGRCNAPVCRILEDGTEVPCEG